MDLSRNLIGRVNVGDSPARSAAVRPGQLAVVDGERRPAAQDVHRQEERGAGRAHEALRGGLTACRS